MRSTESLFAIFAQITLPSVFTAIFDDVRSTAEGAYRWFGIFETLFEEKILRAFQFL